VGTPNLLDDNVVHISIFLVFREGRKEDNQRGKKKMERKGRENGKISAMAEGMTWKIRGKLGVFTFLTVCMDILAFLFLNISFIPTLNILGWKCKENIIDREFISSILCPNGIFRFYLVRNT